MTYMLKRGVSFEKSLWGFPCLFSLYPMLQIPGGGHGNQLWYSYLEKTHGQRSLAGYSPWGCKELTWLRDWAQTVISVPQLNGDQRQSSQTASKMHVENQRTYNSKNISKKKNIGWLVLPDFNTYYKATVIKTVWYRSMKQNRKEINPHVDGQLISNRGIKAFSGREESLSNKWCWDSWILTCKK